MLYGNLYQTFIQYICVFIDLIRIPIYYRKKEFLFLIKFDAFKTKLTMVSLLKKPIFNLV